MEELDTAIRVAGDGKLFFDKSKDLVWDSLQLVGQCDVYISETREQKYSEFLHAAFTDEVRARARDPEHRREKYSSNSLFEKSSRLDKTVKDLAKDDNKMSRVVKLRSKPSGSGVGKSGHGGGKSGAGSNNKFGSTGGYHSKKKMKKKHSGEL